MKTTAEPDNSPWKATDTPPGQEKLDGNVSADVCVIGAGIAGLATAYLLAREGTSVVVLEDGLIGSGQTGNTTAHLANAMDHGYSTIERLRGEEGARLAAESHSKAISRIEEIVDEEKITCDFERLDGYLFVPPGESTTVLDEELKAARRAGLSEVERLERAPLDCFDTGPCLRFPRQGQFHPLKYLSGLARAIRRDGGRIFTGVHASTIKGGDNARVETLHGATVSAGAIVVATNTPVMDKVVIHTKQAAYLTFAIGARIPRGSVKKALYWDVADPYHYVRVQTGEQAGGSEHDLLIVGGEDYKTGQKDDAAGAHARVEAWARERFPMIESVEYRWAGQVMETMDGLAFIGRNPLDENNVFVVTGDCGMGMTHGTIAGMLLTDLILGRLSEWEKLYDPSRKTLRAAGEYLKENLNVATQYGEWLALGGDSSVEQIARDSGAVIERGFKRIAVYRDERGALHERSAVCPHLGCLVAWNSAEKMWDCPCHGSRFDKFGEVVNGPANTGLALEEKKAA